MSSKDDSLTECHNKNFECGFERTDEDLFGAKDAFFDTTKHYEIRVFRT